ncbi:MAG TPA: hypothetical protein VFT78_01835 [Hanamia sp.]|jgi:hypothetical protein|nr:hypothetical protein [Hanamia sp.]
MGILFISITVGIVILAFILITYFRKKRTIEKVGGPGAKDEVEKKTGRKGGVYD